MAEHPNPTILSAEELRFKLQEVAYREAMSRTKAGRAIEASHEALCSERDALRGENTELWEYVDAMEAVNLAIDNGVATTVEQVAHINRAQEVLKKRAKQQATIPPEQ